MIVRSRLGITGICVALVSASACGGDSAVRSAPESLIASHGERAAGLTPGLAQPVTLNDAAVRRLSRLRAGEPAAGERIRLNLFDGEGAPDLVGLVQSVESRTADTTLLRGSLEGITEGRFLMIIHKGLVSLHVSGADGAYMLHPTRDGYIAQAATTEPDLVDEVPEGPAEPAGSNLAPGAPAAPTVEDGSRVDVLALYTRSTTAQWGDAARIEASIYLNEAFSNEALRPAGTSIRIVGIQEVPDTTPRDLDGAMAAAEVKNRRAQTGADLVLLFHHNKSGGHGVAYCFKRGSTHNHDWRYLALVRGDSFEIYMTPSHELGHLFGAGHSDQGSCMSKAYSFRIGNTTYGTMMSYRGAENRLPIYSNPNATYKGVPVGTAQANNAAVIRETRTAVANYSVPK